MKPLLAAIRFLTVLPLPGAAGTAIEDLARSVRYFPLVGLLLGMVAAAVAWSLELIALPPPLASLALVVVLMSLSGCMHLDGLSDSADGIFSSRPRDRMLEIMRDSHAGPMGVVAILVVVLAKFSALASIATGMRWTAVLLMPLAGRIALVIHMAMLPYARPTGLADVFYRNDRVPAAIAATVLLAAVCGALLGWQGLVVCAACVAAALVLAAYVYRKIGGVTGDTLGAACEVVETVPAVLLAAWPCDVVWGPGGEG